MREQEKLMMSAMATFYFETLDKQHAQKQREQKQGKSGIGQTSFLNALRTTNYGLGGL